MFFPLQVRAATWLNDTELLYITELGYELGKIDVRSMIESDPGIRILYYPGRPSINEKINMRFAAYYDPSLAVRASLYREHYSEMWDVSLNPSGRLLAINAAFDASVGVYDSLTMNPLGISDKDDSPDLREHEVRHDYERFSTVSQMCWMSDITLATNCEDGFIRVYDFDETKLRRQWARLHR